MWFCQNGLQNYVNEELGERFNQTVTKPRLLRRALHGLGVGETTIKVRAPSAQGVADHGRQVAAR